MNKKIGKYIKLGLLVLLSCSVSLTAEAASKEEGGGKSWFKGLFGLGSQPLVEENEALQKQLEALRVKVTADEEQLQKTQEELEAAKAKEDLLRQEKEEADKIAQAARDANASLQERLDTQQREIERLHQIEAKAKAEHDRHVEADKLAATRLTEIKRLREEKAQAEDEVASKNREIEGKDKELKNKQNGSKNYKRVEGEIKTLRGQLIAAEAEVTRLTLDHQTALQQEKERQEAKDKAEREVSEAQFNREKAEAEKRLIAVEQEAKGLERKLAEERATTARLEHINAAQARELLEVRHKAEQDRNLATKQATQIEALEQQLKEKDQEVAREHALHHKTAEQLEEAKKEHLKEAVKKNNPDSSVQEELLKYIDNPVAFFNSAQPVSYQNFKEKIRAGEDYGPAFDLAISHIMLHCKTADIKDSWTSTIQSLPTPANYRGENTALKLVATLHQTLKSQPQPDQPQSDLIIDAYFTISENILANGGCFGINFKQSATDEDLRTMIPALRLTGTKAISRATNLAEALEIILSAYWHIEYSAAPLQHGEDVIFESHRRNTTLAAAQVLKNAYADAEDEILEGLEKVGVGTDRAYARSMWTYYDQFVDEKLG